MVVQLQSEKSGDGVLGLPAQHNEASLSFLIVTLIQQCMQNLPSPIGGVREDTRTRRIWIQDGPFGQVPEKKRPGKAR